MVKLPSLLGTNKGSYQKLVTKVGHSASARYMASLPTEKELIEWIGDAYLINEPLLDVGGDGYWIKETKGKKFFVVFDCMGHGHLATIMTRIYARLLEHVIVKRKIHDPADILHGIHDRLKKQFYNLPNRQIGSGADIAVLVLDKVKKSLQYSGAKMDLIQVAGSEIIRTKGHRKSVGRYFSYDRKYATIDIPIWKDSKLYLFTDGVTDLFGGPSDKKLGYHNLSKWLLDTEKMSFKEEKKVIEAKINRWVRKSSRLDDLLLIGFRFK